LVIVVLFSIHSSKLAWPLILVQCSARLGL
jgi:hypothetical protein